MSLYSPNNAVNTHDSTGRPLGGGQRLGTGTTSYGSRTATLGQPQPPQNQQVNEVRHEGSNTENARASYGGNQTNVGSEFQERLRDGDIAAEAGRLAAALSQPAGAATTAGRVVHTKDNKGKSKAAYGGNQFNLD